MHTHHPSQQATCPGHRSQSRANPSKLLKAEQGLWHISTWVETPQRQEKAKQGAFWGCTRNPPGTGNPARADTAPQGAAEATDCLSTLQHGGHGRPDYLPQFHVLLAFKRRFCSTSGRAGARLELTLSYQLHPSKALPPWARHSDHPGARRG